MKEYFSFTKKERNGVLILVVLIIAVTCVPALLHPPFQPDPAEKAAFAEAVAQWQAMERDTATVHGNNDSVHEAVTPAPELFKFDPNKLSAQDWQRLGVPERTVRTIQRYLAKGGHFNKPEDLGRIYGLPSVIYQRLLPYVDIAEKETGKRAYAADTAHRYIRSTYMNVYARHYALVNINTADSSALTTLRGIGPRLASRIIQFRQKLGGFYSVEQLGETYGLEDSVFRQLRPYLQCSGPVQQIDLNTATAAELKQHPYIRWKLADIIVQYRQQHGDFQEVEDLLKIKVMDSVLYRKLKAYLTIKQE